MKQLRGERARLRFLTEGEAQRLLEACRRSRNEFLEPLVLPSSERYPLAVLYSPELLAYRALKPVATLPRAFEFE